MDPSLALLFGTLHRLSLILYQANDIHPTTLNSKHVHDILYQNLECISVLKDLKKKSVYYVTGDNLALQKYRLARNWYTHAHTYSETLTENLNVYLNVH